MFGVDTTHLVGAVAAMLPAAASQPAVPQHWHHVVDVWLMAIPLSVARYVPVALFVIAAIFALTQKRSFVFLGAPTQAAWRDLRIWTVVFLIPYVVIYLWLG